MAQKSLVKLSYTASLAKLRENVHLVLAPGSGFGVGAVYRLRALGRAE